MAFNTLPAIVYEETFLTQFCFFSFAILAMLFFNLLVYTFRLVIILAVVEAPPTSKLDKMSPFASADDFVALESMADNDDMGRAMLRQEDLFRRSEASKWKKFLTIIWSNLKPLRLIFWQSSSKENTVVTRNITSAIRQLRYHSGSSFFFTRGLIFYILWHRLIPAVIEFFAILISITVTLGFLAVLEGEGRFFFIYLVPLIIVRGGYFALVSKALAFHTIRVISVSTQLTTNVVTEYWDPKVFSDRFRGSGRPSLPLALAGMFYGLAGLVTDIVPFLIVYGPIKAKLPEIMPEMFPLLLKATFFRFWLTILLVGPSVLVLTKLQAQLISPKELTIVQYPAHNHPQPTKLAFTRTHWLRILRIIVQCLVLGGCSLAMFILLLYIQFRNLEHADMIKPWIYKNYLNPRANYGFLGHIEAYTFVFNNILVVINPWRWIMPYDEGYGRWLIFGNEE